MALRVIGVGLGAEAVAPSGWELKADRPVGGLGDADVGCGTGTLGEVPAASTIDPFSACSRAACMYPKQRYQDQGVPTNQRAKWEQQNAQDTSCPQPEIGGSPSLFLNHHSITNMHHKTGSTLVHYDK
jgi:hypothetical protein